MRLDTPNKQGETRRQTLEFSKKQLAKVKTKQQLDVMFAELKPVEVDRGVHHLLHTFAQLSNRRTHSMSGPNPLMFSEIKAMKELLDLPLFPWEVDLILAIDSAYLDEVYKLIAQDKA